MKKILAILSILWAITLSGQEEQEFKTIFEGRTIGGYGAFGGGYSPINYDNAMVFNGRGGIILGHTFAMGIGGAGFVTEYQYDPIFQKKAGLAGGYGGIFLELIAFGRSPVHLSFPVLVGVGGAAYSTWEDEGTDYEQENMVEQTATFGVLEPGVELEFNLTHFFRIAAFLNYRYTSTISLTKLYNGENIELVSPNALTSYSAGLIFKFGKF